jgi:hypothetical protein
LLQSGIPTNLLNGSLTSGILAALAPVLGGAIRTVGDLVDNVFGQYKLETMDNISSCPQAKFADIGTKYSSQYCGVKRQGKTTIF